MKLEFSAGGIVFKRGTTQKKNEARNNAEIFVLVSQHSQHHGWVFPKGLIGDKLKGENKENTAVREVKEETGVDAEIIKELVPVTYWYVWKSDPSTHSRASGRAGSGQEKVKKTVYYYLMKFLGGDIKDHDWEMENVEWLPMDEVEKRLTYKSDKKAWKQAQKMLTANS